VTRDNLGLDFDLIVMDVSFISVTKVLPALVPLLKPRGRMVVLIKPQFEAGRDEVGKGGIIRDPGVHRRVVETVNKSAEALGLNLGGTIESPILGAEGNKEFLSLYEK
jgi:23S rRNA (cytidine1920-2'-O)/16S rRNA (cytidine1409-2'-O)-methyltransferase